VEWAESAVAWRTEGVDGGQRGAGRDVLGRQLTLTRGDLAGNTTRSSGWTCWAGGRWLPGSRYGLLHRAGGDTDRPGWFTSKGSERRRLAVPSQTPNTVAATTTATTAVTTTFSPPKTSFRYGAHFALGDRHLAVWPRPQAQVRPSTWIHCHRTH